MRSASISRTLLILALLVFAVTYEASAAQIVSTMRNVRAVMQERGFYLVPSGTMAASYGSDLAPVQSFEIVRPRGEKITIGRLYTSCTCVQLEAPKRTFERGERAVLNLRNVLATPPAGQMYAIYVQITSPIKTTLRFDTFVQSSQFTSPPPTAMKENIEIIVPSAEDDIAETTEAKKENKDDLDAAKGGAQDTSEALTNETTGAVSVLAVAEKSETGDRATSGEDEVTEAMENSPEVSETSMDVSEAETEVADAGKADESEEIAERVVEEESPALEGEREPDQKPEIDNEISDEDPEASQDVVGIGDVIENVDSVDIQDDVVNPGVRSKTL